MTCLVPWNCQIKGESGELEFFHIWHCLNTWTPFFFSPSNVHVFISSLMPWNICLRSRQNANKEWPLNGPALGILVGKTLRLRQKQSRARSKQERIAELWLTYVWNGQSNFIGLKRVTLVCLGIDLGSCVWWFVFDWRNMTGSRMWGGNTTVASLHSCKFASCALSAPMFGGSFLPPE